MSSARLDLGVAIVVAAGLDLLWGRVEDLVDLVEVEPQTMWRIHGDGWMMHEASFAWVESLGKPTIVHGVGFPVGGCEPPDPEGVALAARSAARLGARHWSEHLSFNRAVVDGELIDAGFLLPPAQTPAGVEAAVAHIAAYHAASPGLPFLVETGVNYLRPRSQELSDGAFVAQIVQQADCGILLDLHNLLTNERNGRQPVEEVLADLPLERVLEIHLAGGLEYGGFYLDAHVGGPDLDLMRLLARVLPYLPNLRAVTFEAVPEALAALGEEGTRSVLTVIQQVVHGSDAPAGSQWARPLTPSAYSSPTPTSARAQSAASRSDAHARGPDGRDDCRASREWERQLAAYTARAREVRPVQDPGLDLLRYLADQNRLSQVTLARPDLVRRLLTTLGLDHTEALLHQYFRDRRPQRWSAAEGDQFTAWLLDRTDLPTVTTP
jgi:uncharacterized protein (UPF0276 family)